MKKLEFQNHVFNLENFENVYNSSTYEYNLSRYKKLIEKFTNYYKTEKSDFYKINFFSAPGRTEICGNHTDHNNGRVLCGSIQNDIICAAVKTNNNFITIKSDNYDPIKIDLDKLEAYKIPSTSLGLVAGVCYYLKSKGYDIGGFEAYTTSNLPGGSGLSSSAAFEALIFTILNYFYNDSKIDLVTGAKASQYAENNFYMKPCGLMDQLGSIYGGLITIDFENLDNPRIEKIQFDFEKNGYALCIVNIGQSHSDLTDDYANVRNDMSAISKHFGKTVLREISADMLFEEIPNLRENDRAIIRAYHYLNENKRVENLFGAFKNQDINKIIEIIKSSGYSSFNYLQNVYSNSNCKEQPASLGLYLAQMMLEEDGAWRIHGGGFGGTIQCIVPLEKLEIFEKTMKKIFGNSSVINIYIRNIGACRI
ncbi:MAG: galactokinase [Clostridia bacterium]|nr:galactokinase [Clostridia bacterium]